MENSFQTSFIPKKPISSITGNSNKFRAPIGIFPVLAVIILAITILSAVGLFFYKSYLQNKKDNLSTSISEIKDSFDQEVISDLESFDKKISTAKDILSSHLVLSPMFTLLGELTLPSIQYTNFEHQVTDDGFSVQISGIARDYKSIAMQADVFNGESGHYFKNVIFSNLIKDAKNNVTFDLEFNVDPSILSYENNVLLNKYETNPSPLLDNSKAN